MFLRWDMYLTLWIYGSRYRHYVTTGDLARGQADRPNDASQHSDCLEKNTRERYSWRSLAWNFINTCEF